MESEFAYHFFVKDLNGVCYKAYNVPMMKFC